MARRRTTPYPVQVKSFIQLANGERQPEVFSAKDLYEQLEHADMHAYASSVGAINKALQKEWAAGTITSFADDSGQLLRESEFVAPGSAAVEHPQIFGLLNAKTPDRRYQPIGYQEAQQRGRERRSPRRDQLAAAGRTSSIEIEQIDDGLLEEAVDDLMPIALALAEEHFRSDPFDFYEQLIERSSAPAWLPAEVIAHFAATPHALRILRLGLDKAAAEQKRSLVMSGLTRKGDVTPGSAVAVSLGRLAKENKDWWERICIGAARTYAEQGQLLGPLRFSDLADNLGQLVSENGFSAPHLLFVAAVAEIHTEELELMALELASEPVVETKPTDEISRLRNSERLAWQEQKAVAKQLRELERKHGRLQEELAPLRAKAQRLQAVEDELKQLQPRAESAERELHSLRGVSAKNSELRRELKAAQAEVAALQSEERIVAPADIYALGNFLGEMLAPHLSAAAARIASGSSQTGDAALLTLGAAVASYRDSVGAAPATPAPVTAVPVTEVAAREDESAGKDEAEPIERRGIRSASWTVLPLGGAAEIGGSAFHITTPSGHSLLLDCGQRMPNGQLSQPRPLFHAALPEPVDSILISHAHLDHIGSLPILHRQQQVVQGSKIPVFASRPTRELSALMLADSARVQANKDYQATAHSDLPAELLQQAVFDEGDVNLTLASFCDAEPYQPVEVADGVTARFCPVAHILGSCAIRLEDQRSSSSLLYSGDLGPLSEGQLSLPDFGGLTLIDPADLVLIESTYGELRLEEQAPYGRQAKGRRSLARERLFTLIAETAKREGQTLLPCFSLGRMQELMLILAEGFASGLPQLPIYVGGMGQNILDYYRLYGVDSEGFRWAAAREYPSVTSLDRTNSRARSYWEVAESVARSEPGIILASPAFLMGGWSQTFARLLLPDPRSTVIFSGYTPPALQPKGFNGGRSVRLAGKMLSLRCGWESVSLSAHAPGDDLRAFAREIAGKGEGSQFGVIHGERASQLALCDDLADMPKIEAVRSLEGSHSWQASL